jgi:hypothetical protein
MYNITLISLSLSLSLCWCGFRKLFTVDYYMHQVLHFPLQKEEEEEEERRGTALSS